MINLKLISLLFMFMLILGCSRDSRTISETDNGLLQSPEIKQEASITIGPLNATKSSIITLRKKNITLDAGSIRWIVNGITDETSEGYRFASDSLRKGDIVQAAGKNKHKEYRSNEIVIRNTPPVISNANLIPKYPTVSSAFTINVNAKDEDNDQVYYLYKWYINDVYRGDDSFLETEMQRGDMVSVEVIPGDGEDSGRSVKLKSKIHNAIPVVNDSSPDFNGQTYTHRLDITDPDNDTLSYVLKKGPEAMTIDPTQGVITWEVTPDDRGYHDIEVTVNDNNGAELIIPFTAMIGFK